MSHFRFSDTIKLIVLLWINFFYNKRRIIKSIDSWLQQMCQEDKSNLFYVCRTFWTFEKGICKAFMPTLLAKKVESNVTPRSSSEWSLSFTDKLVASSYIPEDVSFPFFSPVCLQLYDSSSCLMHSLSEKVCNCRAVTKTDLGLPCLCTTVFLLLSLLIFNFIVQCRTALYISIFTKKKKKIINVSEII